jgi:hypothetical protein
VMNDIKRLEKELEEATARQMLPEVYANPERAASQARECRELQGAVAAAYHQWEEAEERLEAFQMERQNNN